MSTLSQSGWRAAPYISAGAWSLGVIALTTLHHVYGALVYETPYRMHIALIALPFGLAIAGGLLVAWLARGTRLGSIALMLGTLLSLGFCVAAIGIYEGGYNHLVGNIAYFAFGTEAMQVLYGNIHQFPNDAIFEVTGIGQFGVALGAAWSLFRLWQER